MTAPAADVSEEINECTEELKSECEFAKQHNETFSQLVYAHIKRLGYSKANFEILTLLSGRTFDRIKADELESPSLETVMAICIGLDLGMEYGQQLLEITGHKLGETHLHRAYLKCLTKLRGHSIYECNTFLEEMDLPALCKRALKND